MAATKNARTTQAAPQSNGTQEGTTKMEAVRVALEELGKTAKPLEIQGFVKQKFDMDLDISLINNYKHLLTRGKGKGKAKKHGARKAGGETQVQSQGNGKTRGRKAGAISLQDIETVRELKNRLGEEKLKYLIKVLG